MDFRHEPDFLSFFSQIENAWKNRVISQTMGLAQVEPSNNQDSACLLNIADKRTHPSTYECKVQNLKKRKVTIHVSVNGVRVVLKKRRRKKKNWSNEADEIELLNHPIYRIFYVSHDSSDLKIFSYIARDASTDTFKCSVFKSHKKIFRSEKRTI
uniref:PID domain-containing protein n=1 Tax=Glossina brevipalpis TaxID=37001 RepID=A0A1A9WTB8_9MUSC